MNFLGGNPWDWIVVFLLFVLAVATGIKDGDETVVPKEVVVRACGVGALILVIFNLNKIIGFFF